MSDRIPKTHDLIAVQHHLQLGLGVFDGFAPKGLRLLQGRWSESRPLVTQA